MEITGRLTADASVRKTKDSREFVAFTVVDNHRYKTKAGEYKEDANFFNCTYWLTTAIAAHLKKGMIVTLSGRVGLNAYQKKDGDYMAHLTFHVNGINFITGAKEKPKQATEMTAGTEKEDLPF